MEVKEKKCKGTGKAKGFESCGKMTKHRVYGLCKMNCYPKWLLETPEGRIKLEKATLKVSKPRRDLEKEKKRTKERKSLSSELEKTKVLVNKYVRLRDVGKPCISQNIPYQKDHDAGHCYSVKQYSGLRFDLDNIHGQSVYANRYLEGDETNYLLNLPNRIGKERSQALKIRAEECKRSVKKWSFEELKEIQEKMKILIKELNK